MTIFILAIILINILLVISFNREIFRIKWSAVGSFSLFILLIIFIKFLLYRHTKTAPDPDIINWLANWQILLVFWEDLFFGLTIFTLKKYFLNNKVILFIAILLLSLFFGAGHLYQGYLLAGLICLYPYFISYRYGVRFGFGTVMVCHILYDVSLICFYLSLL